MTAAEETRQLVEQIRQIREDSNGSPAAVSALVDRLLERIGDLERSLEFMLSAPYEGLSEWSLTLACARLNHPRIRRDETRTCYCKFTGPGGWGE